MPTKTKNRKSTKSPNNQTSSVTIYPSFQALAEAAKDRETFETPPTPPRPRTVRSAADVPRERVEWLWPERIPLGKVTLLVGDPGLGKTLIATDLAARTSRGASFPSGGTPGASSDGRGSSAPTSPASNDSNSRDLNFPAPCAPPPFASSATTNQPQHAKNHTAPQPPRGTRSPGRPGVCLDEPTRHAETTNAAHVNHANHPQPTTNPRQSRGLPSEHAPHSLPPAPCPELSPSGSGPSTLDSRLTGSVLFLSANDSIADTLRPRLEAHGADLQKIFFADEVTDLRHDLARLEETLDEIPDCRLLVVDPVTAFVGPSDSHYHTIVRKVLAPLGEIAARRKIAILAVTHLRKNTGRVIQSAAGSMGFAAAARTVWTVCRDPADATRNLLLPVKNNVGPLSLGLAYSISTDTDVDAPIIHWQPESIANTAEDIVQSTTKSRGPAADDRRHAGEWLKLVLADRPQESWRILREGKENGFSGRTLQRALHEIGGQTRKRSFEEGWDWCLPGRDNASTPNQNERPVKATSVPPFEKTPSEKPGVFDESWRLRENNDVNAVDDSIESLTRLDSQPDPSQRSGDEDPLSPTGHARLDQLLAKYRQVYYSYRPELLDPSPTTPPPTPEPPPPSTAQTNVPAHEKSARSHSRFSTGTDSWHFTRPAEPCDPGAMHPCGVSAQAADESTTRRRKDAI
jgi:hypothetical protein